MRRAVFPRLFLPLALPFTISFLGAQVSPLPAHAQTRHREGEYGGVTPGERSSRGEPGVQGAVSARRASPGTLTWLGFTAQDGGAQVFFQSVAPFEVQQRLEGGTLVVNLGLSRLAANTGRPVDTRFFATPLARIAAKRARAVRASKKRAGQPASIEVRITFKDASDAREGQLRTETGPDGMHYVFLTFPGSSAPAAGPTLDDPEI